jgi:O-antigen/teichoic acid export membrane protein
MGVLRKLASQTAIYGLSSIVGRVAAFALTPIYTNRMEPGEYGIFNDLYAFTTYFLVILTFGMETAFFRFSDSDKSDEKPYTQSFLFVSGFALLFLVASLLGYNGFASLLGYESRPNLVLLMLAITFLDVITSIPMAKLRFDERPVAFAAVSLVSIAFNIGLNLFFILGLGYSSAESVFLANLLASVFKIVVLLFVASPLPGKFNPAWGAKMEGVRLLPREWKVDGDMMRSMAGFGFYIMLAGLFGMINQNSDVNFVQRLWGSEPQPYGGGLYNGAEIAGIFSANKKLAVMILLVTQAFRYAAEPFFFRHAQENQSRSAFAKVFHYFMLASLVVFLLVSSFAPEMVAIEIAGFQLVDDAYWMGLEVVPLMLFSFVLWGAYTNLAIWYKLTKQVRFGLLFSALGVVTVMVCNFALIPTYAYMGATWAMVISYAVMCVLVYISGQKYYPIPYRMDRMLMYGVVFVGAYFVNAALMDMSVGGQFWGKMLVCLVTIGGVAGFEKLAPIKWEQAA